MNYKHLTAADRGAIEVLLREDCTVSGIAKKISRHKSTVCREIKDRSTPNGYFADVAQLDYEGKREKSRQDTKLSKGETRNYVLTRLQKGWSPEQISGWMKRFGREDRVCHETIYKFVYEDDYCKREKIYQYLRYGRKKRQKWSGSRKHRCKIPNRVNIEQRPKIVEERVELGHWEGDSVVYAEKKAVNTMNELVSGLAVFTKLDRKTAELTKRAMTEVLNHHVSKTTTVDNGTEFMGHEGITEETGVQVYFCDPYSSWQRGANENVNMLLRGYLPKKANIGNLTQGDLDDIAWELNHRPRKRLGYLTPAEVYQRELSKLSQEGATVAVRSRM